MHRWESHIQFKRSLSRFDRVVDTFLMDHPSFIIRHAEQWCRAPIAVPSDASICAYAVGCSHGLARTPYRVIYNYCRNFSVFFHEVWISSIAAQTRPRDYRLTATICWLSGRLRVSCSRGEKSGINKALGKARPRRLFSSFAVSPLVRRNIKSSDLQAMHSHFLFQLRESRTQFFRDAECTGTCAYKYRTFL